MKDKEKIEPEINNDFKYYTPNTNERICVPAYERIKTLYAWGRKNAEILEVINSEFEDILVNPLGMETLKKMIGNNQAEFDKFRMELGLSFRAEIEASIKDFMALTRKTESRMVKIYRDKIEACLDEFENLDFSEKDEDGNYVNTSRIFVIHNMIKSFHQIVEDITGTKAMREIELFRLKLEAKAALDGTNLIPAYGRVIEESHMHPGGSTMVD